MKWVRVIWAVVVLFAMLLVIQPTPPATAAAIPWWSASYGGRTMISIQTADALPDGYTIFYRFNHAALVGGGTSLASGNDIRIARYNGTSWSEIDRILAVGSSWNTATTEIAFETKAAISASTTNTEYFLYYNYAAAGSPPANTDYIYEGYDDFNAGSIDTGKWDIDAPGGGTTPVINNGELQIAGTTPFWGGGVQSTNPWTGPDVIVEGSIRSVSQSDDLASYSQYGVTDAGMGVVYSDGSPTKRWGWNFFSPWEDVGTTKMQGAAFTSTRVGVAWTSGGVMRVFEDGQQVGIRPSGAPGGFSKPLFHYHPLRSGTYDVRFDNFVARKWVLNAPTVSPGADVEVSVVIDPHLTFTVGSHAGACNGVAQTSATSATGTTANLGRISVAANSVVAQDLRVVTNAALGFTVFARSSAPLTRSPGGQTIAHIAHANSAPGAFPALGTAGLGYTTSDATLAGTANRFTNPSANWAGLSASNAEIMYSATGYADITECVAYRVGAASTTTAGSYSTSVVYAAVPSF